MSVKSAYRSPFFVAVSAFALSAAIASSARAQSRPDLDALVYGGSRAAQAPQPQPVVVMQQPQQPQQQQSSSRGLFTSAGATMSASGGGALSAIGDVFKRAPRAAAPQPMNAQAQMSPAQPVQLSPAPQVPRNDLDATAYSAPPASPPPADTRQESLAETAPAPSRRGLLTGSKFAPSSGGGALAALGRGMRASPRSGYAQPMPVRYAPPPLAPSTFDSTYRVDAGDRLRIVVYGQDGLTNTYQIGASGSITMPLIGGVPARGRTPAELAGAITGRLRDGFIREPSVAVEIEAYRPFFILGEVAAPGQYPYVPHMSVESAIAIAGGFSPRAKRDRVTLTHSMPEGLLRVIVPPNTPLNPGDTIMVGERWF